MPRRVFDTMTSHAPGREKYIRLREIADEAFKVVQHLTPCRRGCAHCCYMAVGVSEREAELIASHIGRRAAVIEAGPEAALRRLDENVKRYQRVACPFLGKDNDCTIYHVRPMACRTHHSLEDSPAPCDLFGGPAPIKSFNFRAIDTAVADLDLYRAFGDIREFFPPVGNEAQT